MTPARLGIIIALLATTLLGATGALVYRFAQRTNQSVREATSAAPTETPSSSTSSLSTNASVPADWKTYISERHDFSIQYPENAEFIEEDSKRGAVKIFVTGPTQKTDTDLYDGVGLWISSGSLGGKTLKEFVEEQSRQSEELLIPTYPITIAQMQGFAFQSRGLGESTSIYLPAGENQYLEIANFTTDPTGQGFQQQAEKILSTLKLSLPSLSGDEQLLIDSWLEEHDLNQYGDSKDTFYAGGTPLFDERTGERTDRYDYIVKKYPERPWNQ